MNNSIPFQFLNPGWLLLLPLVWWLSWLYCRRLRRQSMWNRICDPRLLDNMVVNRSNRGSSRSLLLCLVLTMTLAILAAAGPSWRHQSYPMLESARARVVALDLSSAMLVRDVEPNRFAHATTAVREILESEFDGETGLVVFAGSAFVVAPLSRDSNTLLAFLDALEPDVMPEDGNRIDLAIDAARNLLEASYTGTGQILIVTVGAGNNVAAIQASLTATEQGHRVSVFAIGSETGGPRLDSEGRLARDNYGNIIISKTNFELLHRIARIGNGSIVTTQGYGEPDDLILSGIGASELVESERVTDSSLRAAANDGVWLVWLMLPVVLLLFRKNLLWMIPFCILLPDGRELYAGDLDRYWKHPEELAFEAYQQGDYKLSATLSANPRMQASAYYRDAQFERALELFAEDDSAQSIYNRGNSLAQLGRLPEAIAAYRKALSLDPEIGSARYNLRLIEAYLEQGIEDNIQQSGGSDDSVPSGDGPEQPEADARIGIAGQQIQNPGDDPQLGPGLGASAQSGPVDPIEQFDGFEQDPGRFILRAQADGQLPEPAFIDQWIKSLPETSTDLFRRKFLRDHQRRIRQAR